MFIRSVPILKMVFLYYIKFGTVTVYILYSPFHFGYSTAIHERNRVLRTHLHVDSLSKIEISYNRVFCI